MRFKEVDIKNRDFLADFSPNPNIVTYVFFALIKSWGHYLVPMEGRFLNFQKKS